MTPSLDSVRAELAPQGTLKVGLNLANFLLVSMKDPSHAPTGIAPDLAREVAREIGVPIEFFPYATPGEMADAAQSGVWNMALLAVEPVRQNVIDFSAPYLEIEATYLVPANSPLQRIEDVDRAGVRIAVMHKSAYDLYLSRSLEHAQLVQMASMDASYNEFVTQGLEALSGLRPRLVQEQAKLPGSRVLDGRFTAIGQAIGVPKGGSAAAAFLRDFVERAKASGLVAQIIERNGVQGVTGAGPAA